MTHLLDHSHEIQTMQALVFKGPNQIALETRPRPTLLSSSDALVRITKTTLCGTDVHILKGDVPTVTPGRILGHEGVGVIASVGENVTSFKPGDKVIIACVTSCSRCSFCRKGMYSHCTTGGWQLGNTIDGTQAEYVRIPYADTSLYLLPAELDAESGVMLSDILPTGLECGVLNGQVKPGDRVAIVGAGPVGISALLTAQLYSPAQIIMIDRDANRLEMALSFGATDLVQNSDGKAVEHVLALTDYAGVDVAIEAVGLSETFDICQGIIAPGGHIANIGVHGKSVELHLEKLWAANITLTTRLLDTSTLPTLLTLVKTGRLEPQKLVTHHFPLSEICKAYDVFLNAARENALKVIISNSEKDQSI